jgi:hypothetical protein
MEDTLEQFPVLIPVDPVLIDARLNFFELEP